MRLYNSHSTGRCITHVPLLLLAAIFPSRDKAGVHQNCGGHTKLLLPLRANQQRRAGIITITRRSIHIGGQTQGYSNPRRSLPSTSAALLANVGNHQPKTRTKRSFEVGRDEVERVLSQGAGADAFQQRRLQEHTDTPIDLFCLRGTGGCVVNVTRSYRHPVGDVGLLQTTLI